MCGIQLSSRNRFSICEQKLTAFLSHVFRRSPLFSEFCSEMSAQGVLSFLAVVTDVLSSIFSIAALASAWHRVDTGTVQTSIGLFQECFQTSTAIHCSAISLPKSICSHSGRALGNRHGWAATFLIIALLLYTFLATGTLVDWFTGRRRGLLYLVISNCGLLLHCLSNTIFVNTYHQWLYCGVDYCTYARFHLGELGFCIHYLSTGFFCSLLAGLFGFGSSLIYAFLERVWKRCEFRIQVPENCGARIANSEEPASEWQWIRWCELYWSSFHKLFLDPARRVYFDPVSRSWYNPETDAWVQCTHT
jgi:hypothetical protein